MTQQGATINKDYIKNKIQDYNISDYFEKLKKSINSLEEIIKAKAFLNEMIRFIPTDVLERTLEKEKFLVFLVNEIRTLLREVGDLSANYKDI